MKKNYILIAIVTLLMLSALIYAFMESGSPFKSRNIKIDQTTITNLTTIKYTIEDYYRTNKKLPDKLSDLKGEIGLKLTDSQTNQEYEYKIFDFVNYQLCASFLTDSSEIDETEISLYSPNSEFEHSKGDHCFKLSVADQLVDSMISGPASGVRINDLNGAITGQDQNSQIPAVITEREKELPLIIGKAINDPKIASVSASATKIYNSASYPQYSDGIKARFPEGLFSNDPEEYGIENYANETVRLVLDFRTPVKISSITNIFSGSSVWDADGYATNNTRYELAKGVISTNDNPTSTQLVESDKEFTKLMITAKRIDNNDGFIHWQKVRLGYK